MRTIYRANECTLIALHTLLEDSTDLWIREAIKENNDVGFSSNRFKEMEDRYNLQVIWGNGSFVGFDQRKTLGYILLNDEVLFLRNDTNVMVHVKLDQKCLDGSDIGHSLTVKLSVIPYLKNIYCVHIRKQDILRRSKRKNVNNR